MNPKSKEDILSKITDPETKASVEAVLDFATAKAAEAASLGQTAEQVEKLVAAKLEAHKIDVKSIEGLQDQLDATAAAVVALKEGGSKDTNKFRSMVEKLIKGAKDNIIGKKRTECYESQEVEAKVATTIATTNVTVSATPYAPAIQTLPGFVEDVLPQQTIMGLVDVQSISKPSLSWVEETAQDGNATFIGEGVIKPLVDWDFATKLETAKKIANRTVFTEEAVEDLDFMEGAIRRLQGRDLDRKMATAVLSATESSTSVGGITTQASSYTITALNDTVVAPTLYDVINAMNAQVVSLGFVGRKTVVVNPYDWAIAKSEKDSQFRDLNVAQRIRDEFNVVEDPEVAQGYVLFGELSYFKVWMYKMKGIRLGYSSGDWEYNRMSAIAENRLITSLALNHAGAIIYDAVATVKAAIELEQN